MRYFTCKLELVSNIFWLIVDFHGRWETFNRKQQNSTKSSSKMVKEYGRRSTSSFTLEVSVKLISPYNKSHARENVFYLKLQVCAKVRLTQLELHKLSVKLRHCAKITLTHVERQPTHNKSILSFTSSLSCVQRNKNEM